MSGGERTSPSRWIARIEIATALARSTGATSATIAAFTGPVEAKRSRSPKIIATR